jgi:hypothetical protein
VNKRGFTEPDIAGGWGRGGNKIRIGLIAYVGYLFIPNRLENLYVWNKQWTLKASEGPLPQKKLVGGRGARNGITFAAWSLPHASGSAIIHGFGSARSIQDKDSL